MNVEHQSNWRRRKIQKFTKKAEKVDEVKARITLGPDDEAIGTNYKNKWKRRTGTDENPQRRAAIRAPEKHDRRAAQASK